jgi:hypothetical protein
MHLSIEAIVGIVGVVIAVPPAIYALKPLFKRFFGNAPEKGMSKPRQNTDAKYRADCVFGYRTRRRSATWS